MLKRRLIPNLSTPGAKRGKQLAEKIRAHVTTKSLPLVYKGTLACHSYQLATTALGKTLSFHK